MSSSVSTLWPRFLESHRPSALSKWELVEKVAAAGFLLIALNSLRKVKVDTLLAVIPGAAGALKSTIDGETAAAVSKMFPSELTDHQTLSIPSKGLDYDTILASMQSFQKHDPQRGRVFGYMYHTCDDAYDHFIEKAYTMFMHENALNPSAFPALRKMEVEVVAMTLNLLHGPMNSVGTMTSGGTESLLLTIKSYRDRARELYPNIKNPEIIMSVSIHVAVPKACAYFDCKPVFVDVDEETMKMNVGATEKAINKNTILLLVSAPQYPHGVVDPVEEIAQIALKHNLSLHVDACMGGFLLPWIEKLGYKVPLWDFRVKGVTSISADIHKYGYSAKGASTLSWINQEYRQYQFFAFASWPGGMFVSPSMCGTRPGGAIAGAYAALLGNGESGYLARAKSLMACSKAIQQEISEIPEFRILGEPHMSIVSWQCKKEFVSEINVFAVADVMEKKFNFKVECQQNPTCLHVTLTPPHCNLVAEFISALKASIAEVRAHPELNKTGNAATYGLIAKIPSNAVVDQFLVSFLDKVLKPHQEQSSSK